MLLRRKWPLQCLGEVSLPGSIRFITAHVRCGWIRMFMAMYLHICSAPHSLKISLNYLKMRIYKKLWVPNAVAKMPIQEMCFTGLEAFNENGSY